MKTKRDEKLEELTAEIKNFRKVLFGNGSPGLCEDVREIKKLLNLPFKFLSAGVIFLTFINLFIIIFFKK